MEILDYKKSKMIRELPVKSVIDPDNDWLIIEGRDGTKKMKVDGFMSNTIKDNLFFDNVEELKNAKNLAEDSIVYTKGFSVPGDGGAARYEILYAPGEVPNERDIISINARPVLKARLSPESTVTPEQFGAIGNGIEDDTDAVISMINSKYTPVFQNTKKYKITKPLYIPNGQHIDFNGVTFILSESAYIKIEECSFTRICNLTLDCVNGSDGIIINNSSMCSINNVNILNIKNNRIGISVIDSDNTEITHVKFYNKNNIIGNGILIKGSNTSVDTVNISDCSFDNIEVGIDLQGSVGVGPVNIYRSSFNYINDEAGFAIYNRAMRSLLNIDNINVFNGSRFLHSNSTYAYISLSNIEVTDTYDVYLLYGDKENSTVVFSGSHRYTLSSLSQSKTKHLFNKLDSTINLNCTFNIYGYNKIKSGYGHSGVVRDIVDTKYHIKDNITVNLAISTGTLSIDDFRNMYINVTGYNIININPGIEGQIIELVSSDNIILKNLSTTIVLSEDNDITLHNYKGVKLIYLNSKWIQIY